MKPLAEQKQQVLLVEDEWLLASDLARNLQKAGYGVIGPVPTVADAIEKLDDLPNAAILDVQLDGETTFELAAVLETKGIPFFFLSGHSDADFPQMKGRRILSKPAELQNVLEMLKAILLAAA